MAKQKNKQDCVKMSIFLYNFILFSVNFLKFFNIFKNF